MRNVKNVLLILVGILVLSAFTAADKNKTSIDDKENSVSNQNNSIQWTEISTAEKQVETANKKYFVYVYTDWCGYCKKLKSTTFTDAEVIRLLNEKFVPIMFNAESKEPVTFKGKEFKFVANGRRGYHEFAAALLNNQLSYPTLVFLDENMNMIQPLPGYKSAPDLKIILKFLGNDVYENMTFEEFYKKETEG